MMILDVGCSDYYHFISIGGRAKLDEAIGWEVAFVLVCF